MFLRSQKETLLRCLLLIAEPFPISWVFTSTLLYVNLRAKWRKYSTANISLNALNRALLLYAINGNHFPNYFFAIAWGYQWHKTTHHSKPIYPQWGLLWYDAIWPCSTPYTVDRTHSSTVCQKMIQSLRVYRKNKDFPRPSGGPHFVKNVTNQSWMLYISRHIFMTYRPKGRNGRDHSK